jgi:hypothetical protein
VAHEDVTDAGVHEGVVGRKVRAAGEAEYDVHTLRLQALHDGIDRTHVTTSFPHENVPARVAGVERV